MLSLKGFVALVQTTSQLVILYLVFCILALIHCLQLPISKKMLRLFDYLWGEPEENEEPHGERHAKSARAGQANGERVGGLWAFPDAGQSASGER